MHAPKKIVGQLHTELLVPGANDSCPPRTPVKAKGVCCRSQQVSLWVETSACQPGLHTLEEQLRQKDSAVAQDLPWHECAPPCQTLAGCQTNASTASAG